MSEQLTNWYNQKQQEQPIAPVVQNKDGMVTTVSNWQNTPEQTVQGQTENIIKNDSPLIQLARTGADQQSQSRGLTNSSMAIGASQDAVYRAALPIAQADAAQSARVAGYNVDTLNKANEFNATNQFSRDERIGRQDFDTKERIANNAYDFEKTQFTTAKEYERQSQNMVSGLAQSFQNEVSAINKDPNMTQQAKTYALSQLYESYKTNLSLISNVNKIANVSTLLTPIKATAKAPKAGYKNYTPPPPASGGGKMICTRCYQLGLMSEETYLYDDLYSEIVMKNQPDLMRWYWNWATPIVAAMHGKTWQSRFFIKGTWFFVKPWSEQMVYEMGGSSKGNWFGKALIDGAMLVYRLTRNTENIYARNN